MNQESNASSVNSNALKLSEARKLRQQIEFNKKMLQNRIQKLNCEYMRANKLVEITNNKQENFKEILQLKSELRSIKNQKYVEDDYELQRKQHLVQKSFIQKLQGLENRKKFLNERAYTASVSRKSQKKYVLTEKYRLLNKIFNENIKSHDKIMSDHDQLKFKLREKEDKQRYLATLNYQERLNYELIQSKKTEKLVNNLSQKESHLMMSIKSTQNEHAQAIRKLNKLQNMRTEPQ